MSDIADQILDALTDHDDGVRFDLKKLEAAQRAFKAALTKGDPVELTKKVLGVAFFLDFKKGLREQAMQVVALAKTATATLQRLGHAFDDIANKQQQESAKLLGQSTSNIPVGQRGGGGAKWWNLR